MKSFFAFDETLEKAPAVDFLDNLDSDMTNPIVSDVVQDSDNIDNSESLVETEQEPQEEVTALVVTKPNSLFVAQTMFKKSVKISIKSFLISLSLGFLNLFL